jgi:hypothetical protein
MVYLLIFDNVSKGDLGSDFFLFWSNIRQDWTSFMSISILHIMQNILGIFSLYVYML